MPVTVMCPNLRCRATLSVPDKVRGKRVRCPECSITFQVPAPSSGPPAKPAQKAAPAPTGD